MLRTKQVLAGQAEHCGCHAIDEHVRNWLLRVVRTGPLQTCWSTACQPQCSG